jgi:Rps23 Pro-64 3,4-dihydroxylase Tpa1-like proline 4-hydroxylase
MSKFVSDQYEDLVKTAQELNPKYTSASPFPSISIENFFNAEMLEEVLAEFPDLAGEDAIRYNDHNQKKFAGKGEQSFKDATRAFMHFLNSEPFLKFVQTITGIEETLLGDPYFSGGGLHEIKSGGLLKVHADFNKNERTGLDRRVNVLVYLNKDWKEEYGGHFELWDREMKQCEGKILPTFNTLAMFSTTSHSYHGHPDPLTCPDDMSRKSLALYYYSNGRPKEEVLEDLEDHTTLFKEREGVGSDKASLFGKVGRRKIIREITPPVILKMITGKKG